MYICIYAHILPFKIPTVDFGNGILGLYIPSRPPAGLLVI